MRQITDKSIYLWVLKWLPVIGTALIASHYGKESKTSASETAGDGSWQIQASAEIRRVSKLLAMAINGRRAKLPNTIV